MGGKQKRIEPTSCKEWRKKEIWEIPEQGNFIGFMEKLKGNNPTITWNFIKTWRDGTVLVENQRMEVIEEIISKATGLEMEGINFY